jgi:hypothetical protein
MIPIKGYATFDPLKHCWLGSGFKIDWFKDLPIGKSDKIMDPLKRIAEETEEDYQALEKILNDAGVKTYRSFLDIDKYNGLQNVNKPPTCPRDHFAVIAEKLYAVGGESQGYSDILKQIPRENLEYANYSGQHTTPISTATICRVGKDLFWDVHNSFMRPKSEDVVEKYKTRWTEEGFRVHISNRGHHTDGEFCVIKPGCIVSLFDVQDYAKEFPGWDVLYLPDQSWELVSPFWQMKKKCGGQWWLSGEEHNDQLIEFVNTWLNDWVGYVEETVFDVNMLSIDHNTIICNNYNKEVFNHFKKHKVEPIIFNFRHRYFWDGGVHCITQDLYREGKLEDYIQ